MPMRPCLDCGHLSPDTRCGIHARAQQQARDARRGSSTQRGLGSAHRRQAAAQIAAVPYCERCGHQGSPDNPLTAEHGLPRARGGSQVTGTLCRSCNSSSGGSVRRHMPDSTQ